MRKKKFIRFFLSGILLWCCRVYAGEVSIIGTADLHGYLENLAHLAPVIKRYPQAIKVDAGDLIQGRYAAAVSQGKFMFEALNLLGYDVFVPGNHEFEFDSKVFDFWRKIFRGRILGVQWQYGSFVPDKYMVVSRNGYRIGIVGVGENTLALRKDFYRELSFADAESCLRRIIPQLRREKPDAIVLVCHIALQGSFGMVYQILQEFPEIDAAICCHSHREHPGEVIADRLVAQPGAHGKSAVLLKLTFSAEKRLSRVTSSLLRPAPEADAAIMAVSHRMENSLPAEKYRETFDSPEKFAIRAASALRIGCGTDAAVCGFTKKYFSRQMSDAALYRLLPFGNRMMIVNADAAELQKFVRRHNNEKYACFADIVPGRRGMLKIAVPDHLLWKDSQWRNLSRQFTSLFERETILQNLEKSR